MVFTAQVQYSFQRYEKKYLLTADQYEALRAPLAEHMCEDQYGCYTICNIYYDTPDFQLIRTSLEKPIYKEKLRVRSYGVPTDHSQVFVEVKKKFDGVVYKRRTVMQPRQAMEFLSGTLPCPEDQISREIAWLRDRWQTRPQVFLAYDRRALADRENSQLRITFDTDLRWRTDALDLRAGDYGSPILSDQRVLMEIKFPGVAPLWLAHLLSQARIFPTSFSKYGTCYQNHLAGTPSTDNRKAVQSCA